MWLLQQASIFSHTFPFFSFATISIFLDGKHSDLQFEMIPYSKRCATLNLVYLLACYLDLNFAFCSGDNGSGHSTPYSYFSL